MLQIPLVKGDYQQVVTTVNDVNYTFETTWNSRTEKYAMNVYSSGTLLVAGIQLVGGVDVADYTTLPLSRVYCVNRNEPNQDLDYEGLGADGFVMVIEDSDLE